MPNFEEKIRLNMLTYVALNDVFSSLSHHCAITISPFSVGHALLYVYSYSLHRDQNVNLVHIFLINQAETAE